MTRTDDAMAEIVTRRPFAVLGYSAEDAVWCPACLRSAAGLSPERTDTSGQPILPLYARDATVQEEVCDNCERSLYELLATARGASEPKAVSVQLRRYGERTTLSFDRVPPIEVRSELKAAGWRWDPRLRLWWSADENPPLPAGVVLPAKARANVAARPPVIRKRS
jgi:hypothetical protein